MMAKLPKDAVFMVMSDHGFHSFRRSVNLNTWLVQNGYMVFHGQADEQKLTLADLFGRGRFWEGVDWTQHARLRGGPGPDLLQPARARVPGHRLARRRVQGAAGRDRGQAGAAHRPRHGRAGDAATSTAATTSTRASTCQYAPDLQVGFNDGYRVGWQDTMGGVSRAVVENNNRKWSGDHCATAAEISGGVFFVNRKIDREKPHIMDSPPPC